MNMLWSELPLNRGKANVKKRGAKAPKVTVVNKVQVCKPFRVGKRGDTLHRPHVCEAKNRADHIRSEQRIKVECSLPFFVSRGCRGSTGN